MVFQAADHDLVACLQPGRVHAAGGEPMGHHVQRIGGARGEHQLVVCARSDKALERAARVLERIRGALAQRMHATVDVGPVMLLEGAHRLLHRHGHLGGGRVVEVSQLRTVDALREHRELRTHSIGLQRIDQKRVTHVRPPAGSWRRQGRRPGAGPPPGAAAP